MMVAVKAQLELHTCFLPKSFAITQQKFDCNCSKLNTPDHLVYRLELKQKEWVGDRDNDDHGQRKKVIPVQLQ